MRRVYREHCPCPPAWRRQVEKALPDHVAFRRQAIAFEKLRLSSKERRNRFSTYAPGVLAARKSGKVDFPAVWGRHKAIIAAMSSWKCAYCEGMIDAPRAAKVDHFKPKALFPSLAYEWTNYFLACEGCNGAKGDKWPERGGYVRPDYGDPSRHFVFAEDGTVQPASGHRAAERMVEDFDLKRKGLVEKRRLDIELMMRVVDAAAQFYRDGNEAQAKIFAAKARDDARNPKRAYSSALTQCFWRAWENACPGVKV